MAKNGKNGKRGHKASSAQILLLVLLALALLFVLMGCKLTCKKRSPESFKRVQYAHTQGGRMVRSPVDYYPRFHKINPHVMANPNNKFQPLESNPVDLEAELNKLTYGPPMFNEFSNWYKGPKDAEVWIPNDSKTRMHLRTIGDGLTAFLLDDEILPEQVADNLTEEQVEAYARANRMSEIPGWPFAFSPANRRLAAEDLEKRGPDITVPISHLYSA